MISMFSDVIAMARLEEFRREAEQWRLARQVRASSATTDSQRLTPLRRLIWSAIASRFRGMRTDGATTEQTP